MLAVRVCLAAALIICFLPSETSTAPVDLQTSSIIHEAAQGTVIIIQTYSSNSPRVFTNGPGVTEFPSLSTESTISPLTITTTGTGTIVVVPTDSSHGPRVFPTTFDTYTVIGVPIPTPTPTSYYWEPGYVPDPSGRGTVGLLSTCILTLFLCVWTAMHLNVFPQNTSSIRRAIHKTSWALLALFAPEVVLWRAISQWQSARTLYHQRNQILLRKSTEATPTAPTAVHKESQRQGFGSWVKCILTPLTQRKKTTDKDENRRQWCFEHGFFTVMGGFEVTVDEEYEWLLYEGSIVTPLAVVILAELGKILPVSRETLAARSKADSLGKTLVCLQAGWVALQTIVRKVSRLPITLLELNTLAHVACAVIMYGLWWHKPQDVRETAKIHIEHDLATLLSSHRFLKYFSYDRRDTESQIFALPAKERQSRPLRCLSRFGLFTSHSWEQSIPANVSEINVMGNPERFQTLRDSDKIDLIRKATNAAARKARKTRDAKDIGVVMLLPGQWLKDIPFRLREETRPIHLSKHDIERLQLMAELQGDRGGPLELLEGYRILHPDESGPVSAMLRGGPVSIPRAPNMSIPGNLELSTSRTLAVFAICGLLYGGVHLTAWNSQLPSMIEQLLFRIAAATVAGGGIVLWAFYIPVGLGNRRWRFKFVQGILIPLIPAAIAIMPVVGIAACLARIFLVVEAFTCVRSLPLGAYSTVSWVGFFPHIGS